MPEGSVVDGEIVIATPHGLDFDALQLRLHPAASRVAKLAAMTPAAFVAFDVLAVDWRDVRGAPQGERRALLEQALANVTPPIYITPMTRDPAVASSRAGRGRDRARVRSAGLDAGAEWRNCAVTGTSDAT